MQISPSQSIYSQPIHTAEKSSKSFAIKPTQKPSRFSNITAANLLRSASALSALACITVTAAQPAATRFGTENHTPSSLLLISLAAIAAGFIFNPQFRKTPLFSSQPHSTINNPDTTTNNPADNGNTHNLSLTYSNQPSTINYDFTGLITSLNSSNQDTDKALLQKIQGNPENQKALLQQALLEVTAQAFWSKTTNNPKVKIAAILNSPEQRARLFLKVFQAEPSGVLLQKDNNNFWAKGYYLTGLTDPEQIVGLLLNLREKNKLTTPGSSGLVDADSLKKILSPAIALQFMHERYNQGKVERFYTRHPVVIAFLCQKALKNSEAIFSANNATKAAVNSFLKSLAAEDKAWPAHRELPRLSSDKLHHDSELMIHLSEFDQLMQYWLPQPKTRHLQLSHAPIQFGDGASKAQKPLVSQLFEKINADDIREQLNLMMLLLHGLNLSIDLTDTALSRVVNTIFGKDVLLAYLNTNVSSQPNSANDTTTFSSILQIQPDATANDAEHPITAALLQMLLPKTNLSPQLKTYAQIAESLLRSSRSALVAGTIINLITCSKTPKPFIAIFLFSLIKRLNIENVSSLGQTLLAQAKNGLADLINSDEDFYAMTHFIDSKEKIIQQIFKSLGLNLNKKENQALLINTLKNQEGMLRVLLSKEDAVSRVAMQHVSAIMELFLDLTNKMKPNPR